MDKLGGKVVNYNYEEEEFEEVLILGIFYKLFLFSFKIGKNSRRVI